MPEIQMENFYYLWFCGIFVWVNFELTEVVLRVCLLLVDNVEGVLLAVSLHTFDLKPKKFVSLEFLF